MMPMSLVANVRAISDGESDMLLSCWLLLSIDAEAGITCFRGRNRGIHKRWQLSQLVEGFDEL
jgi:hypothetical protein